MRLTESVSNGVPLVEALSIVRTGMVRDPQYGDGHLQMHTYERSNACRGCTVVQGLPHPPHLLHCPQISTIKLEEPVIFSEQEGWGIRGEEMLGRELEKRK